MVINMLIKKVSKQGPCKGVIASISKVNKVLNDPNIKRPIYMLGKVVHNSHVINAFKNKGIIILDGATRIEMVKQVNSGTVIITAHGVSDEVYEYLSSHKIDYVDATCVDVKRTKRFIKDKLNEGYKVIYIGTKNHPESEGIINLIKDIIFVDINDNSLNLPISLNDLAIVTCQTTLSHLDVIQKFNIIKEKYPQVELANEICNATIMRQNALIKEVEGFDLCIVVGDKHSNNTKSLKETCLKYTNTECIQIENVEDLNDFNLENQMKIIITSGASTPSCIVDEIIDKLQNSHKPYKCEIDINKYIE